MKRKKKWFKRNNKKNDIGSLKLGFDIIILECEIHQRRQMKMGIMLKLKQCYLFGIFLGNENESLLVFIIFKIKFCTFCNKGEDTWKQ